MSLKTEKNQVQILHSDTDNDLSFLENKHLLVDTNFLIDAVNLSGFFEDLIQEIKKVDCFIVGIHAVLFEFTKGNKSIQNYKKLVEFYDQVIDSNISIILPIMQNVSNISKVLKKRGGQLSYVDALLLATLMQYSESGMYLISRDRSDIPTSLFPIKSVITVDSDQNNCFYSIYSFDRQNYVKCLKELI